MSEGLVCVWCLEKHRFTHSSSMDTRAIHPSMVAKFYCILFSCCVMLYIIEYILYKISSSCRSNHIAIRNNSVRRKAFTLNVLQRRHYDQLLCMLMADRSPTEFIFCCLLQHLLCLHYIVSYWLNCCQQFIQLANELERLCMLDYCMLTIYHTSTVWSLVWCI